MMPTPEQVDSAIRLISKQSANCVYFFGKLDDPAWIMPLKKRGMFAAPPELETDEEGRIRPSHIWPQSMCLSRIVAKCDDTVREEILEILLSAGKTNNYFIHSDFADAVLVMNAHQAARWARHEAKWLRQRHTIHGSLDQKLGKLISKLAKEGDASAALELAGELLAVLPDPEAAAKLALTDERDRIIRGSLEPTTHCDRYAYEQVLRNYIPDLTEAEPLGTLELLCSLLEKAILFSQREGNTNKPHDATFIWRPAIEDSEQNRDYKIDCPLITAVRDTAEGICARCPEKTSEVVQTIEKHGWNVFKRIGMHILRVAEHAPIELIADRLRDKGLLTDPHFYHEYYHLLKAKFHMLSAEQQQGILSLIGDENIYGERSELSPEQKLRLREQWQHRILTAIKDDLPPEWKERYAVSDAKAGTGSMPPDFNTYSAGAVWRGPQSPRTREDLEGMSVDEVIAFLKEWRPSGEWMSPTPDGLGLVLGEVVQRQADRFVAEIEKFKDADIGPTYIRHILSGFCRVLEGDGKVAFEPVLGLCRWVLAQDQDVSGRGWPADYKDGVEVDRGWRFAHGEVLRFIERSLSGKVELPYELRAKIWALIEPLTDDPDPSVQDEEKRINSSNDPLSLSINSKRGRALHATMQYAMWVYRHIKDQIKVREGRTPNFTDVPEVLGILSKHLDLACDATRTSRAVYGQWMAHLAHLGPSWVKDNLPRLFPPDPAQKGLRDAVWNTYLVYGGQLQSNVVDILRDIYREKIQALRGKQFEEESYPSPERRLAEHTLIIFLWDEYARESDRLIDLLFRVAPQALKTHVWDFCGRDVFRSNDVDPDIIGRMRDLWESRLNQVGGFDGMDKEELATFGWWFASGKFEANWALKNLEETLKRTPINPANLQAMEQLSDIYDGHPSEVLRCLKLFVAQNTDPWFFAASRNQKGAWTILEQGMAASNPAIRDQAEEIVHLLGSKGYLEYRELLRRKVG